MNIEEWINWAISHVLLAAILYLEYLDYSRKKNKKRKNK